MSIEYLLFVILGFGASLVSAVFGFGTALIVLAIGAHILPVKETIALATVLFVSSTLSKTILFGRYIDWKLVAVMSLSSLPFAYLGAVMLHYVPAELLRRLLGGMILCYLTISWSKVTLDWKPNTMGLVSGSAAYGFVSGLLGSGNLVKVMIFRELGLSKEAFVGAMAATSVLANAAKLVAFTDSGLLHSGLLNQMTGLVVSAISAAFIGRYFLTRLTIGQFNSGLQWVLGISALGLLF